MSEASVESLGLCLSEDQTAVSLSMETGEAPTVDSLSVASSFSLTKISAANSDIYRTDNPPLLITLQGGERHATNISHFTAPPSLLSVTQQQFLLDSTTSGVTPSGTTLEGTLDDIPELQDFVPITAISVTKKDQDAHESEISPYSSPVRDSNFNLSSSPQSATQQSSATGPRLPPYDSRFLQEVKRSNTLKPSSSVKSYATISAPKTSTSGVTVVEVKIPPKRSQNKSKRGPSTADDLSISHSLGSVRTEADTTASSMSKYSDPSLLQRFQPELLSRPKPFLLHVHPDEGDATPAREPKANNRVVLGNRKVSENQKVKSVKSWHSLENRSQTSSHTSSHSSKSKAQSKQQPVSYLEDFHSRSSSSRSERKPHQKRSTEQAVNYMDHSGIKRIVKDEMTAVVSMQNDIWHKILDSFVDKAARTGPHQAVEPTPYSKPSHSDMVMLKLPEEEPITFFKPLHIPILKPNGSTRLTNGPALLQFPSEDDPVEENVPIENGLKNHGSLNHENYETAASESGSVTGRVDAGMQTTAIPPAPSVDCAVQHNYPEPFPESPTPNQGSPRLNQGSPRPTKMALSKGPHENLGYQEMVNRNDIPLKVMQECKMLLESIQDSAKELKEMKSVNSVPTDDTNLVSGKNENAKNGSKENSRKQRGNKDNTVVRTKHEIFLERFFDQPKKQKFLDVVDISRKSSGSGHFEITKRRKPSSTLENRPAFLHSTDIIKPEKKLQNKKPSILNNGLGKSDLFKPKRQIPRSPLSTVTPPLSPLCSSPEHLPECSSPGPLPATPPASRRASTPVHRSPGEITEEISDPLSSIGKYLSEGGNRSDVMSISEKTIENGNKTDENFTDDGSVCEQIDESVVNLKTPTPVKKSAAIIEDEIGSVKYSGNSSESYHPHHDNPVQISLYIADNLLRMKQAYSESQRKEIDRSDKVNLLLQSRKNPGKSLAKPAIEEQPKQIVDTSTRTLAIERKSSKTKTSVNPPVVNKTPKPSHVPAPAGNDVSGVSSDTTLPSNTDDLLRAALGSDVTLAPEALPHDGDNNTRDEKSKVAPQNQEKKDIDRWMKEKRRSRMIEFKKDREQKIKQEPHPFEHVSQSQTKNRPTTKYDRKAAVLRRLNMAEEMCGELKRASTTKPAKTRSRDRTTEWVEGLNMADLDSVHSPSLTSEGGASEITEGISLP